MEEEQQFFPTEDFAISKCKYSLIRNYLWNRIVSRRATKAQEAKQAGEQGRGMQAACLASARRFSKWPKTFPFLLVTRHQRNWCCNGVFLCPDLIMMWISFSGLRKILVTFKGGMLVWAVTLTTLSKKWLYSDEHVTCAYVPFPSMVKHIF